MYLSAPKIQSVRQFGVEPNSLLIEFNKGVTALVGENDAGKSSIIDTLRFALQTRDGEYLPPSDDAPVDEGWVVKASEKGDHRWPSATTKLQGSSACKPKHSNPLSPIAAFPSMPQLS